jgi:NAD+ synthase
MKINPVFVEKLLTRFIKEELHKFGYKKGILGLSGGLDSTVCAFLAARSLDAKNVIGLILPYKDTFAWDVKDAENIASQLHIESFLVDISPMVDAYFTKQPTESRVLKGNKMARERMSILYDFSARKKALILGTSNKTELLLGYGTIHGDMACAINPMGDLYKTQIRQLARYLKVPEKILKKKPTAGLWAGQTDEGELGLSYAKIDQILYELIDLKKTKKEVIAEGFRKQDVENIIHLMKSSEFKRRMPPLPKISDRTVGHDVLFPYDWDR